MKTKRRSSWRGRFFEDFEVGDHFEHPLGRTITEADNAWFTLLTMNTNELHFNDHYAEQRSITGRQIVNSGLSVAMVLGISVSDISQNAIANLGWTDIELLHPVLVGDTLYADSVVTGCRRSASRPHAGIVECVTRGINQDGVVVMSYRRSVLVSTADSPAAAPTFPTPKQDIGEFVDGRRRAESEQEAP